MQTERPRCRPIVAVALAALAGCDGRNGADSVEVLPAPGPFSTMVVPLDEESRTPGWSSTSRGLLLSWQVDSEGSDPAVRFAELVDGRWSAPRTIVQRHDLFVNWADFPSVVDLGGDSLAVHWLQHNGPGTYAYQVHLAFSGDRGATWSDPLIPHETETETEHGFVSLLPGPDRLELVWLDGRAYEGGSDEMSLRTVAVRPGSGPVGETVLDGRVCDCCQTSMVRVPGGVLVAYRGRSENEIRDIEVVRRVGRTWSAPSRVHEDDWRIDACPVNGPALAADGETVIVTWFTAANDTARVYGATSADGGRSFGAPIRLDDGRPLGRVDALAVGGGRAVVAWTEAAEAGGAEIRLRAIDAGGNVSPSTRAGAGSEARAGGFPVLARFGSDLYVAWTDPDAETVRVARGPSNLPTE